MRIITIDRERAACRELMTDSKWGQKETYHLCVNTSGKAIFYNSNFMLFVMMQKDRKTVIKFERKC